MSKMIIAIVAATATASAGWMAPADAQQRDGQQRQPTRIERPQGGNGNTMLEDLILLRLAEREWVGGNFQVDVDGGVATLGGTVPSEAVKARMGRIVRETVGVTDVRNELQVTPRAARAASQVPDEQLARQVAQRIASAIPGAKAGQDWWLQGWRVEGPNNLWSFTVEAEDGRLYLDGEVPRPSIMRKAIDAARQTAGVNSVRSNFELDRYRGYPPYPGYAYHDYTPYHPWLYDPAYGYGPYGPGTAFSGAPALTGQVTSIDRATGQVTVQTDRGQVQLPFPSSALQNVQQGDRVTVRLEVQGASPAASPRAPTTGGGQR